jgi:hypothetical protein
MLNVKTGYRQTGDARLYFEWEWKDDSPLTWPGTYEGLLAGMRADMGYKGESRSLCEPTTVAGRPLACVVRLVYPNVRCNTHTHDFSLNDIRTWTHWSGCVL